MEPFEQPFERLDQPRAMDNPVQLVTGSPTLSRYFRLLGASDLEQQIQSVSSQMGSHQWNVSRVREVL